MRDLRERLLVIRGLDIEDDPRASALRSRVDAQPAGCSANHELAERVSDAYGCPHEPHLTIPEKVA